MFLLVAMAFGTSANFPSCCEGSSGVGLRSYPFAMIWRGFIGARPSARQALDAVVAVISAR
jgi:hypothetical protein